MKNGIVFSSASGNTKLLAEAIQIQMNCPIFDIHKLTESEKTTFWQDHPFDFIFIGTGIYGGHVGVELHDFLIKYPPPPKTKAAIFGTWAGWSDSGPKTFTKLMNFLEKKGLQVIEETYLAYGKMGLAKLDHPNADEIQEAGYWANRVLK